MNGMLGYWISRTLLSAVLGLLLYLVGAAWWLAVLVGIAAMGWFAWAPKSGRYAVTATTGEMPMRRDERGELIRDRAARNGFVGLMLAAAALGVYAALAGLSDVPSAAVSGLVLLGFLVYFASDLWLRRGA